MKLGRHIPASPRPVHATEIAQQLGCDTIQIFVNNPTGWKQPQEVPPRPGKLDPATAFAQAAAERGLAPVVVHAPYLINLASPDETIFDKSVILLGGTIQRASRFGARYVVFHIGSHRGTSHEAGIARIALGLDRILPETPEGVVVLLENDVGAGHEVGAKIESLAAVLAALPNHAPRLGICLDTAHLWGAGIDLSDEEAVGRILSDVDRLIGLPRLPVIHLNDTATPLGSHRDLHKRIGEGIIPEAGLRALLRHPALQEVAFILETPIEEDNEHRLDWAHDTAHLARVRALGEGTTEAPQPQSNMPTA
ncbi:MAG TPA: deoxyribonuclease IV [Ktedonobacterales bacterium]|nr:deoxyribonuclease IV [Ktedonobacterales bacterium]